MNVEQVLERLQSFVSLSVAYLYDAILHCKFWPRFLKPDICK